MKIVKVTYTVKQSFAKKNLENVKAFISDLSKIDNPDLLYNAFLGKDGATFYHMAIYRSDDAQKILFGLPSFQSFQKQRDDSGLEVSPKIEELELIASTSDIFKTQEAWQRNR